MKPDKITIHCSATPNGKDISIDDIRAWHIAPPPAGRGWSDIGYHWVIGVDGIARPGRPESVMGAGVEGANADNIHVCLVGTDRFKMVQFATMKRLIDGICERHQIPPWEIYTHNSFPSAWKQGKVCPGMVPNRLFYWLWCDNAAAISQYALPEN